MKKDVPRRVVVAALPMLVVFFTACGGGGDGSATSSTVPPTTFYTADAIVPVSGQNVAGAKAFDDSIIALMRKWNVAGATLAVAKNGQLILARGYGYADFEGKQALQPDAMFRIGSLSKLLTSMAVLHLHQQGLVNLDEKFLNLLPEYQTNATGDTRLADITVRNLLQHSGGWDRDIDGDPLFRQSQIASALSIQTPVLCPDIIRYMMGRRLNFTPGTRYVYSNFGYCILGRIVEKISGQPYQLYVRDQVLAAMDVHAMSIGHTHLNERGPYEVKYYSASGAALVDSVFPGEGKVSSAYGGFDLRTVGSAGGWIGSTIDMTRVVTAIDGSRMQAFLSPGTMAEFTADPHLPGANAPGHWYGLGMGIGPTSGDWQHSGYIDYSMSLLTRDARGYVWVVMVNAVPANLNAFLSELNAAVAQPMSAGLEGSSYDLYPQYGSPVLPP